MKALYVLIDVADKWSSKPFGIEKFQQKALARTTCILKHEWCSCKTVASFSRNRLEFKCGRRLTVPAMYSVFLPSLLIPQHMFDVVFWMKKLSVYVQSGGWLLLLTLLNWSVLHWNDFSTHKSVSQYRLSSWHGTNNSIKRYRQWE